MSSHGPETSAWRRRLGRFYFTGVFWYRLAYFGVRRMPSWAFRPVIFVFAGAFLIALPKVRRGLSANLALVPVADKLNASKKVLTDKERSVIRLHPERSAQALEAAGIDNELLLRAVRQHHERADGSGYPKGLSGTEITPEAEIQKPANLT